MKIPRLLPFFSLLCGAALCAEEPGGIDLTPILSVESEGAGNEEAAQAWEALAQGDVADALAAMRALQGANPLAANYLRSGAAEAMKRAFASAESVPTAALGEFLLDTQHSSRGRRLAYDLLRTHDPEAVEVLLPGLLHDPAPELRHDAVGLLLVQAGELKQAGDDQRAALVYRQALGAARSVDQAKQAAEALRELGREVDLPRHFGFLMYWELAAPFDNAGRQGFAKVFPPETGEAAPETWQAYATSDPFGVVDFNTPFGMQKEVVGYARTTFHSEADRSAQIRLGGKNAWKVWLNGELLFGRDEYHRGMKIDQYLLPCQLQAGENVILVKCCQNEQKEQWTVEWQFQLRVCDASGAAILSTERKPTPEPEEKKRRRPTNKSA